MTVVAVILLPLSGFCDGKFFWHEKVPPGIPYQRAAIMFDDGREVLILQSKYELEKGEETDKIGWVVPLPAVPELASMDASVASMYFHRLDRSSSPDVTDISSRISPWLGILFFIGAFIMFARFSTSIIVPSRGEHRFRYLLAGLLMLVASAALIMPIAGRGRQSTGVDVVKAEEVGIYDVKVVKSDSSKDLIEWLNGNDFKFDDSDKAVFDDYVSRGWCFVAAKVNPSRAEHEGEIVAEGLVAPLIMRFPTKKAVYPLALTGTAGQKTEVLLYVLTRKKTKADKRFELEYVGKSGRTLEEWVLEYVEPEGFFSNEELNLRYLCKYRGKLNASEMKEDLKIGFAGDDEPYRKHIVRW